MNRPPRGPLEPVVAVLTKRGRLVVAEPLFDSGDRISLPGRAQGDGRVGDIVLVGGGKRGARVLRRIGRPNIARDVLEALMLDQGLRRSFPYRVEEEATDVSKTVPGTSHLRNGATCASCRRSRSTPSTLAISTMRSPPRSSAAAALVSGSTSPT